MDNILSSRAEKNALAAQELQTFSGFNLVGVKLRVKELLSQIGRTDIFASATAISQRAVYLSAGCGPRGCFPEVRKPL